jgi:transcriptional regulator with GAF, ATPase, and Fis domain
MNWPGNVRSLKHFLQRLDAIFGDETITVEHMQVLQNQDLDNYLKPVTDQRPSDNPLDEKAYEKAIMKIEYLLKASVFTNDVEKRKALLKESKESIEEIIS